MAEEKVTIALNTTREDIRAVFEENPSLKKAFYIFWEKSQMDAWIEQTVIPDLEKNEITVEGYGDTHEMFKEQAMLILLQEGMKRFVTEHAATSFERCILKTIEEEAKGLTKTLKEAHSDAIESVKTRKSFNEFLKFLLE